MVFKKSCFGGNSDELMVESDVQSIADLVDYVHTMLNQGLTFKIVAKSFNINDSKELKELLTKALDYNFKVYSSINVEELFDKIEVILPIDEHGAN